MGRSGPQNKLLFSIDGPGGFLLAPGGPGCKSAGPCHLCITSHRKISVVLKLSNFTFAYFFTSPGKV